MFLLLDIYSKFVVNPAGKFGQMVQLLHKLGQIGTIVTQIGTFV